MDEWITVLVQICRGLPVINSIYLGLIEKVMMLYFIKKMKKLPFGLVGFGADLKMLKRWFAFLGKKELKNICSTEDLNMYSFVRRREKISEKKKLKLKKSTGYSQLF